MKLRNDKILIFGGGSGIGKAIAKRFCELGAKVLIVGRTEEKLLQAKEEIGSDNLFVKVFDILQEKNKTAFYLYPKEHERLFWLGSIDIGIRKRNYKCQCGDIGKSFDSNNQQNVLLGRSGKYCFIPLKIIVIQMK